MNKNLKVAVIILIAGLLVILGTSIALHFAQKSHNHLEFSIEQSYPQEEGFVPGEIIARTLVETMENELDSTFGWRPNDIFLWGPYLWSDNNANRQMGIIQGIRETNRVFRDNLTKLSSDEFDLNLLEADTMFRNDAKKFMLPSAEKQFSRGVEALKRYIQGLHAEPRSSRPLNKRNVELIKLFDAWTGLLGDAHANLYRTHNQDGSPVRMWETDNYFYQAQGNAAVMYFMMQALEKEYGDGLTPSVKKLFHEVDEALETAATLKPIIVLNGSAAGITANSRRNLDAFVSEGRDKMFSIVEELQK
jgi:hypothetical protein